MTFAWHTQRGGNNCTTPHRAGTMRCPAILLEGEEFPPLLVLQSAPLLHHIQLHHPVAKHSYCTMVCILQYLTFPFTFILLSNQSFVPCIWTHVNATPICRILSFDGPVADLASLKVTTLAESGEETLTGLKSMLRQILAGHSKGLKLTQASYSRPREIHSSFMF